MPTTTAAIEQIRRAFELANGYVISDIECHGQQVHASGSTDRWYDVSAMLNPNEQSSQLLDMNRTALDYAEQAGLIKRHRRHAHLVRILRGGA